MKTCIAALMFLLIAGSASCQTSRPRPLAAYSAGDSVFLVSKAGKVVSTIHLPVKVGEFAFSPDLKRLVVVTPHPHESGGEMYLYSLASRRLQQIPVQAVLPKYAKSEVYSDPQFSADGTGLFFSTHPQAKGDLYDTSGPIAELDLKSLRASVLTWTMDVFTDNPMLSPNGREFFLPDEGKVIDTDGKTIFNLHGFQLEKPFKWVVDEAWIGNRCVLEEGVKSGHYPATGETSYFVLDLKTLKSTSTLKTLGISDEALNGLVAYRFPYAIVRRTVDVAGHRRTAYFLVSPGGASAEVAPGDATVVRVLPDNRMDDLPAECR